ncbi:Ser/Thr protein kinase RdoA (MazF antagonist) [Azospirillum lipoferum]|uniref:Hydroxylysine kinase n=1 Tax=Azospirillum lipoferum TaxID=193 RepID=A0A5A9GLC1_AZOLI|nr:MULTISPECIES: phosphotransferase [Azospirillum]KAA0595153.1 phosphotransferase [Azospirillum lipoferum]MCP1611980.1 Ser/Thr protein kinase RdoA (MazF antagonist) [Azospirillum lipoferum]MDW5533261.1 phosphotransferase [Azospirillum sp. NL1]
MTQRDVLTTVAPPISVDEAGAMMRQYFGLSGTVRELSSERDRNFHITTPGKQRADGQSYVLKFTNPAEPQLVTAFQTGAMQHVALRDPVLPVPRVVPTVDGEAQTTVLIDGQPMILRLLTYLDGTPLHAAPASPGLMRALGTTLARLDLALSDYEHPGSERDLLWDITRTASVADKLRYLADGPRRRMVERFIARFADEIDPRLPSLRHQVIHNDLNPHNAVVDPVGCETVTGIIDFGDALKAPLVNDLATALAYHVTSGETPFGSIVEMTRAYNAVLPLTAAEVELLPDLVAARLALAIAITSWRAAEHPANADYIRRNSERAFAGLERLTSDEAAAAHRLIHLACQEV